MDTLIINKRHEIPAAKRWGWDAVTLALWGFWIYLWTPLLRRLYQILLVDAEPDEIPGAILETINVISFHKAVIMLTVTPIILFILSRLNRHQAPSEHLIYEPEDYADYFGLDPRELAAAADAQIVTVYHDDHGQIVRLEP